MSIYAIPPIPTPLEGRSGVGRAGRQGRQTWGYRHCVLGKDRYRQACIWLDKGQRSKGVGNEEWLVFLGIGVIQFHSALVSTVQA